uniref:WH1 domain-containing protein n=1 Tax=Caenorhabditis tropicalis TaxID=1561998 RepID=A0A1I7SYX4_9PELO
MITSDLSDFLEYREKDNVLKAISASDKILSSGICQFLVVEKGEWAKHNTGAAVVLFLKNSSERYYRMIVIEPSSTPEWEPTVQFDFIIRDKKFETVQIHANLLVFEKDGTDVGLNFYDSKECENFHNSVCKRQSAKSTENLGTPALEGKNEKKKKKKGLFHNLFSHKETKKTTMEIGEPTNFRHVDGVTKMTADQEDLYHQVMSKLKTNGPEEEEIVKQLVLTNEEKFRKSMMVKKESQTVKGVKEKNKEKSKSSFWNRSKSSKIEDVSQPVVPVLSTPVDPLKPDWSSDRPSISSSSISSSVCSSSTVTVTSSFKHSHTFAADPLKNMEWDSPRKDTYGVTNQREPQNIYRFEQEKYEERIEIEEKPPELPSRSTSRNDQMTRTGLSTPRLPSHRGSYRWATQPETIPKQAPSPVINSHQVDEFTELKLVPKATKTPIRAAPPPPPATPPSIKPSTSTTPISPPKPAVPKSAPPPPSPSPSTPSRVSPSKAPPPPPPLPPIAAPSSAPPPPPLPPTSFTVNEDFESSPGPPSVTLSSVPESTSDRRSLMDQIRSTDRSKVLRKVSDQPDSRQSVVSPTSATIVDQIQNFLDARRAGINPSDSEESDDDDDEDWSD